MEPSVLLAAYPHIPQAIAWVELIICHPQDGEQRTIWNELILSTRPPLSVKEVVDVLKASIEGEDVGRSQEARTQMDHPTFSTYIAGKLGAV